MAETVGAGRAYDHEAIRGSRAPTLVGSANGVQAVARRLAERKDELARRTVARYRAEVVGFQSADAEDVERVTALVIRNIEAFLASLQRGERISDELLVASREAAARHSHEGVTLDAIMHLGRLWGETVWESVLEAARPGNPAEREAALAIAGLLWRHVDVISTVKAVAYLDEVAGRGLVRRELLDALLAGRGDEDDVHRLASGVRLRLSESYVVVLARADELATEDAGRRSLAARTALDRVVEAARTHLRPADGVLLVGVRQGDVIALYPVGEPEELDAVRRDAAAMAGAVPTPISIGMSGWHPGLAAIATGYAEAREAAEIARATEVRGRAVVLDDVLVDHMLHASAHARRILEDTLRPLTEYDVAHRADLVGTLRAYLAAGTNLTQSARLLMIHPNTVVYRLRRIRELTGRDPHVMDDLQVLFLALKLDDLSVPR
jgi:sugar diacid utilization regulator